MRLIIEIIIINQFIFITESTINYNLLYRSQSAVILFLLQYDVILSLTHLN